MKMLLVFLLALPTCVRETLEPQYDIILCVGQSNATGLAALGLQDYGSGAWLWNNNGWEQADGALDRYSNLYPQPNPNIGLSMFNSFGKEAAKHSRPYFVGLVVNCRPGTSIESWRDSLLGKSIQRALSAKSANTGNRITAVAWHQGESNKDNPEVFNPSFQVIRAMVDSLLGTDVPILLGGIVHAAGHNAINDSIEYTATHTDDCYYVPSDSLTTFDGLHFDSPSQRTFGLRYYHEYAHLP